MPICSPDEFEAGQHIDGAHAVMGRDPLRHINGTMVSPAPDLRAFSKGHPSAAHVISSSIPVSLPVRRTYSPCHFSPRYPPGHSPDRWPATGLPAVFRIFHAQRHGFPDLRVRIGQVGNCRLAAPALYHGNVRISSLSACSTGFRPVPFSGEYTMATFLSTCSSPSSDCPFTASTKAVVTSRRSRQFCPPP